MSLRVVAHLKSQEGRADELRSALEGLLAPTREEAGCISYELLESTEDGDAFTFVEEWVNPEALQAHLETSHIQAVIARFGDLLAGDMDLRTYRLVG